MSPRIDAHVHLWRYSASEFQWLEGELAPLRRDFLRADLLNEMQNAGVAGAIAVQARQSLEETDSLLNLAAGTAEILGVVGWLPLCDQQCPAVLESYHHHRALKGVRHVVQAEAPGFMDGEAFRAGISALQGSSLIYDILILERQLEEAIRLVDQYPDQGFVLDHLAKPRIAVGEHQPWADKIIELARRPNVSCKLSGMVTEAGSDTWSAKQLRPFFETVLEAFTPARLMIGTDWPVLTVACGYAQWWSLVSEWICQLSTGEQDNILGKTAARIYQLQPPARQHEPEETL